jgi:hypothetical protein
MRALFDPESDALQQCLLCLHTCLLRRRPALARHLAAQGVEMSMFAPQWFLTLFIYRFPLPFGFRFWHTFLAEGVSAVVRVGVALLQSLGDRLLSMNFDAIIPFFNAMDTTYINEDEVFDAANEVDFALAELALLHPFGFARPHLALSAADVAAEVAACEARIAARAKELRDEAEAEQAERELERRAKQSEAALEKAAVAPVAVEAVAVSAITNAVSEPAVADDQDSAALKAEVLSAEAAAPLAAHIETGSSIITQSVTEEQSSSGIEKASSTVSSLQSQPLASFNDIAVAETVPVPSAPERSLAAEPATAAIVVTVINHNADASIKRGEQERPTEAASDVQPALLSAVPATDPSNDSEPSSSASSSSSVSASASESEPTQDDSTPSVVAACDHEAFQSTPAPELVSLASVSDATAQPAGTAATASVVAAAAAASEERPFACDLCEFRFARSNHLSMHRRVVHPAAIAPSVSAASTDLAAKATKAPSVNAANAVVLDIAIADAVAVVAEPAALSVPVTTEAARVSAGMAQQSMDASPPANSSAANADLPERAAAGAENAVVAASIDALAPIPADENATAAVATNSAVENEEPAQSHGTVSRDSVAAAAAGAESTLVAAAEATAPAVEVIAPASDHAPSAPFEAGSSQSSASSSKASAPTKSKSSKAAAAAAESAPSIKKKKSMF